MSDPNDDLPQAASLAIAPEKVCQVIAKARQYEAQIPSAEPHVEGGAVDSEESETLFGQSDDAAGKGLVEAINDLNAAESAETVALVWLGRGDFTIDEWPQAVALAEERHTAHTADYLLGMPRLGDYLEEGLNMLGYSCGDARA